MTSPHLTPRERAAVLWAEHVTRNTAQQRGDVYERVKAQFSDAEIVELTLICAMFNMINRLNDSFWTELETPEYNEKQWNAVEDLSIDDIEAYAGRFAGAGQAQRSAP